jgi:hypothetical protein
LLIKKLEVIDMRLHFSSKEVAFAWAHKEAHRLGIDYLVVEKADGTFAAGPEKKVRFYFPELGAYWSCAVGF